MFDVSQQNVNTKNLELEVKQEKPIETNIYTMPEKFIPKEKGKKGGKIVLIIIVILILLSLIGAAYFFISKQLKESGRKEPASQVNQNLEEGQPEEEIITPSEEELPSPIIPTTTEELLATTTPTTTEELISVLDADNDGLTEEEEKLYKTDPLIIDTDDDGYSDGEEITNLYSPISKGGKLDTSGLINTYTNPVFKYSLFYPAGWIVQAIDETNSAVIFTSSTGEFIEILILENLGNLNILDWYNQQKPDVNLEEIEKKKVDSQEAIEITDTENGQKIVYFTYQNKIYGLIYNYGDKTELNFQTTFEMMKKSFKF